jgi:hypothetical protein
MQQNICDMKPKGFHLTIVEGTIQTEGKRGYWSECLVARFFGHTFAPEIILENFAQRGKTLNIFISDYGRFVVKQEVSIKAIREAEDCKHKHYERSCCNSHGAWATWANYFRRIVDRLSYFT